MTAMLCDCLIVQPIAATAIRRLESAGLVVHVAASTDFSSLEPYFGVARAVITRNHGLSRREIDAAPNLKVVGVHGTGTDKIDKAVLAERSIALINTPGANAQSVAELTIGLMLACARALVNADQASRTGNNQFRQSQKTFELSGRRLGLVGYGHISRQVARIALAFGMQVATVSRFTSVEALQQDGVTVMPDLDSLCEWADVVSLHGIPEATPVIDARRLALIGRNGLLINTARGTLVDEHALAEALENGTIASAGIDVVAIEPIAPDNPLLTCPNLVLTPHIGGSTVEALEKTGDQVATGVLAVLERLSDISGRRN